MTTFWLFVLLTVIAAGGYGVGFVHGMSSEASRESSDEEFIAEVNRLDRAHRGNNPTSHRLWSEAKARHAAGRDAAPLK
jgi:hypothetical protein